MLSIYLQGLALGLAYVAPIGVQNLFVINSALTGKLGRAWVIALIVTFWDISLGLACFLGAGTLMQALDWLQKIILGVGGILVICIGAALVRSKADLRGGKDASMSLWKIASYSFAVTWLNPQALIDGTMMLGAFRAALSADSESHFITGFASASIIWFSGITLAAHFLGNRIGEDVLTWLNRLCGTVIIVYGFKLLFCFTQQFFA